MNDFKVRVEFRESLHVEVIPHPYDFFNFVKYKLYNTLITLSEMVPSFT